MSLTLAASFVEKLNSVVPLAQNAAKNGLAIRVASNGSDTLGVLTASGASGNVVWALAQNPSWVTISVDPTTLIATLIFSNAQVQANAYQFYVTATDSSTTQNFPIYLEVREPFSIVSSTGATSFSIPSFDSTVADIVFQGVGLNGVVDTGVQFIVPTSLPPGLKFITSDGSSMKLRVSEAGATNVSGGISLFTGSPVSTQITLQAYKQGTIYDNPQRCYTQSFTIESLTAKQGSIDLGLTVQYDTTLNAFALNAFVDFLNGEAQTITYEWDITGTATGNITSGGSTTSTSMVWTPSTPGNVGFIVKVKNATSGAIIGQAVIAPTLNSSGAGIPCSNVPTWLGTNGVKLSFSADEARGYVGDSPTITISTPAAELADNEIITIQFAVSTGSALEGAAVASPTTVTLTASNPSATLQLPFPESTFNQKWIVSATAANAASNPSRTGYAQITYLSNGDQPLTTTTSQGVDLTSNVGASITPITLTSKNNADAVVNNVTYSLFGAPDGLFINTNGQLTGNVLQPGTYSFEIVAEAAGFARSYTAAITLVASAFATPLQITDAVPSVASLPDSQQFNVSWGYSGTPLTLNMLQGFTLRSVIGSTEVATSEVGSSVITIFGTSFYGDAYSVPALVLSSSITANGDLPDAPTIGTIDENFNLTLNWNPLTVDGNYQAYKAWNIFLKLLPNGVNQLQSINGQLPTGLEVAGSSVDSRIYVTQVTAGDWQASMQALTANTALAQNSAGWDQPHEWPTAITDASITFDNQTISLGQTLNISLDPNYIGADTWQAIYPDGTTSGWLPISVKSLAKAFTIAGNLPIIIQTLRDYSKSNPAVKLMRQVTKTIYVMNQQFIGTSASDVITGDLGFGGEGGFETTDASAGPVALQPYEIIVRALVRDTISNELKLMVATSRTTDASSLLGTMAIDVFPILGRPRVADLIDPALYLSAEMSVPGNPVKIATAALPNIIVGKPMADFPMQVAVNSGIAPFSWYADNLPFGIKLSTDGTLTGTANEIGSSSCDFSVVDSNDPPFIAHTTLTVTVESDLKITTTSLPQAIVGTPYNIPIVNTGGIPPFTWSLVAGALPIGLSIDPNTGIIVGTPCTYNSTTDFNKVFTFTAQVVDAIGAIASAVLSMTLAPAALQFGPLDQPEIFPAEAFELTIPVFGGAAPYTLVSFTDDGTIGTGLQVANPTSIAAIAGVNPPALAVTTNAQNFFPPSYPTNISISLSAAGGVAPYQFSVIPGANTNLVAPAIFGDLLTASPTGNGFFTVQVQVTDSLGNTANKIIQVEVQEQNAGNGGTLSIKPIQVAMNGSTNPANWTITPISALPDAKNASPYNAGAGSYYGLALYTNNVLQMSQPAGPSVAPMNFTVRAGALPNGIVAFSGNSFGNPTDFSGIVLFNVSGGQNATVNGSYSFQAEFSNINTPGFVNPIVAGAQETVVSRESITVTTAGGGTTPVVVVTSGSTITLAQDGAVDTHYALTSSADPTGAGPSAFVVEPIPAWAPNSADAKWISPVAATGANLNPGNFTYQTTFDLTGLDETTAELSGNIAADNSVIVMLNGVQVFAGSVSVSFASSAAFSITSGFIAGVNTLQFIVNNGGTAPNPTGLLVQISGSANSPSGPQAIGIFGTGVLSGTVESFEIDLTTATGSPFSWYYPLTAEGGTGPYTFQIVGGTSLTGASIATLNGLPALVSSTTTPEAYVALIAATDANGVTSAPVSIGIQIEQTPTQPIHIVDSNLPLALFAGRPLPANTYFIESDLLANFTATGLPAGISLSAGPGTFGYLSGTPTATGNFTMSLTATSVLYKTTAQDGIQVLVSPQTAVFLNPPTSAIVGTNYRTATNNAIIQVQYSGYLPTDTSFPLVTSKNGTVGAPGVQNNGTATTSVSNLTATGFVMSFDYVDTVFGNDVLTLGNNLATLSLPVTYPPLVATGQTATSTVSEYSTTATFAPPVTVSGGLGPYTVTPTGFSDPRFTALGGQIAVAVSTLIPGTTTSCNVSLLVVDSSGNSTTTTGVLQITVRQESFIQVTFSNSSWAAPVSTGAPFTLFLIPSQVDSVVLLGHPAYQYYVDSVTLPDALSGFVTISPSQRVLAINCNANSASASISDVDQNLQSSGSFIVPAVNPSAAPAAGSYAIEVALRVVDSQNLTASQTVTVTLVIS